MFFLYSVVYTIGFLVLLPRFVFDALTKGKYAAGFRQRLGFIPKFDAKGKKVIWLHCVSVGEVNAARPLAIKLKKEFSQKTLVVSTTTRSGQKLAKTAFEGIADLVFYFPFDWRWTVRRALKRIKPSAVLLMETEIWFNFVRETYHAKSRLAIVNGRLSEGSLGRYLKIKKFMKRVFGYLDMALMQTNGDATRIMEIGLRASKARVTGNMKFDLELDEPEAALTEEFRVRFRFSPDEPLILAASTHAPEEAWVLDAFKILWKHSEGNLPRLMIAPRHPERFNEIAGLLKKSGFNWVRRSDPPSANDASAEVVLLDSIGELRSCYALADVVFVGGSLIPHGGQSIFEPASAGRAIITGPHTANFSVAVTEFLARDAMVQMPKVPKNEIVPKLVETIADLLSLPERRATLGTNALAVMEQNRGAVDRTIEYLTPLLSSPRNRR